MCFPFWWWYTDQMWGLRFMLYLYHVLCHFIIVSAMSLQSNQNYTVMIQWIGQLQYTWKMLQTKIYLWFHNEVWMNCSARCKKIAVQIFLPEKIYIYLWTFRLCVVFWMLWFSWWDITHTYIMCVYNLRFNDYKHVLQR